MNARVTLILSILGIVLASSATIALVVVPTMRDIRMIHGDISREEQILTRRYAERKETRNAILDMTAMQTRLPVLRDMALPDGEELTLIENIEQLATTHGLAEKVRLLPTNAKTASGSERRLQVELTLTGEIAAIGSFFSDLERHDPLFVVSSLTIQRTDTTHPTTANILGWVAWPESPPTL